MAAAIRATTSMATRLWGLRSRPAYIGDNESTKPFAEFIMDGCNEWRNWEDIQCNWGSLSSIIDHWGDYGTVLAPFAGPGHWHDMDMLLVGANCITEDEEMTQMAIWAISASPLIMGNDLTKVFASSKAILLNSAAISVSQDPLGQMGIRLPAYTSKSAQQVWSRRLGNGDAAVALYNKLGAGVSAAQDSAACPSWHEVCGGRVEACGGGASDFLRGRLSSAAIANLSRAGALEACCMDANCEGFTFSVSGQKPAYEAATPERCGSNQPMRAVLAGGPADISVNFADVGMYGAVTVFDIWAQKALGTFYTSYTAKGVPLHGTSFLRFSAATESAIVV
mmetsp:Transcript_22996/g.78287  ORF Transcript_22996/g.78287 Transcript_22996/m.78287 type:complete len:337 (+) Transcript_22996:521-1531(+)